jgi:hypothetical protein
VVAEEQPTVLSLIEKIYGRFALGDGKHSTTVAEGLIELDQHGVMPSLTGGEWPVWCDLYCDGRSVPPVLTEWTDHTPSLAWVLLSCKILAIPAAAASSILLNIITEIAHGGPGHYSG